MRSPALHTPVPVNERFRNALFALREQADSRIFWLLIAQWAVTLMTSFAMASRWKHATLDLLSSAVIWVGILSVLPLAMVLRSPGSWPARWSVVASQGVMSSLLWYVSGGRPDTHLHLFAWLVVLALYRDVPVLVATVAVALAGHALIIAGSVLPALSMEDSNQWFTHLVWLAWLGGETAFLGTFVLLERQTLSSQAERDHAIESLQVEFQGKLAENNSRLADDRDQLVRQVSSLIERRNALDSAHTEVSRELLTLRSNVSEHATAILKLASRPEDSSLTKPWRSHWQALRQQAQHLMRMVDIPSLDQVESDERSSQLKLSQSEHSTDGRSRAEKRAMLMMRNPLHQAKAIAALETEGYRVDVVLNGPRTYYSVMLNDYSVIVVDIDLPDDEGFDTLEALQLLPPDKRSKAKHVFAVTVELTPDRVLRCTNLGVDGMFLKPLQAIALHQSLRSSNSSRPARNGTASAKNGSTSTFQRST